MKNQHPLCPLVRAYRTHDRQQYTFIEFAEFDDHYVAWGALHAMSSDEALVKGRDLVIASLGSCELRDGGDTSGRLKLKSHESFRSQNDLVEIRASSPKSLEIVPQRLGKVQYTSLEDLKLAISVEIPAVEFKRKLDEAFSLC